MKKGGLFALCLILFFLLAGPVFSDEMTTNLQSKIIEDFDNPEESLWMVRGSKFSSVIKTDSGEEVYPKSGFINTWPDALYRRQPEGRTLRVFGIQGKFDRKGYNYVEMIPSEKGADGNLVPRMIPLPGRVKNMDVWVWGSNHDYYLEVHLMDHKGITHALNFGDVRFTGWRNLQVNIPGFIPQAVVYTPAFQRLQLVKFVLWTKPAERVNNFYFYMDEVKIFADLFESMFDGEDLADPDRVQELWSEASGQM